MWWMLVIEQSVLSHSLLISSWMLQSTIGFGPDMISDLMRLVVGVLFAGNMKFTASRDEESCHLNATDDAKACATLLGFSFEGLASALTERVIIAGDEILHKPLTL